MGKINNKGFTLVETLLCFVIISIIMVVAAQIIHSSTETYYSNRSLSFGMQASQIVATEIRGEIEDALPLNLFDTNNYSQYYIKVSNTENDKFVEFIDSNGKQVKFSLNNSDSTTLKKYFLNTDVYDVRSMKKTINNQSEINTSSIYYLTNAEKTFDSKYIGMGYEVIDISITKLKEIDHLSWNNEDGKQELDIGNYPVLELTVRVGNHQYDEYECKEYIPLYNFYGIIGENSIEFEDIINIIP